MSKLNSELKPIAELAYQLAHKPHLYEVFETTHPSAFHNIKGLLNSPFYRWQPFGDREGLGTAQYGFLRDTSRNKWATAGNRAGKTVAGLMENVGDCLQIDSVSKHWDTKFEEPPRIWIVSDTEETAVNVIERTIVDQVLGKDETGFLWNFIDDQCQYTDKNGWSDHQIRFTNGAWIQVKFSTQKRNTFQGVRLDKIHHDEVQPRDVYGECVARLADTNGYFIGTMTPIYDEKAGKGIPWIYEDLYLVRDSKNISFHQWSMLDNPYIPQEAKDRLMGQWDEDEVDARVYGMFVPIGVKLAFPTKLIRSFKPDIVEPDHKSQLMYDEEGNIILEAA